jgi:DNA-directed RNA polymerase specialized sigma24 family protein
VNDLEADSALPNGDSFAEFVELAEPRLRHALVARFGAERGREGTAEALAYAWENWDRIRVMENSIGYLYRVARSRTTKRVSPLVSSVTRASADDLPPIDPSLTRALRRLTARQRTAVVLIHAFDWAPESVAELLGVSVPTVKTHLRRGLVKLRKILEVDADEQSPV